MLHRVAELCQSWRSACRPDSCIGAYGRVQLVLVDDAFESRQPRRGDHAVTVCREQRREKRRREKEKGGKAATVQETGPDLTAGLTAEEMHMMQQLGLPFGFESTQGALVDDAAANESAVKVSSQRKARQFMNRKGGFNRLLPAEQTGKKMQEV